MRVRKVKKMIKNIKIGKKERIQLKSLEKESIKVIVYEANNEKGLLQLNIQMKNHCCQQLSLLDWGKKGRNYWHLLSLLYLLARSFARMAHFF